MQKINLTPDKFGFYKVGDKSTYSKLEAIEWSKKDNKNFEWVFNDNVYSSIDWKIEPQKDLWSMYKERAIQIRNNYDYVVLWYSGGSDSHNMLLAWIEAGCKIDEIATTWNYEATGDKQNHYNAEITNVVLPDIQVLKDKGVKFKFRIVDISNISLNLFEDWKRDFEYNVNFHMSINNPAKHLFRDKIKDYKNLIESGKKVCFVWGKEKPNVYFDNKYYFVFCDNIDNCVGPYVQKNYYRGWYDELFYWSPDYPELAIKAAHVIKNYCELSNERDNFSTHVKYKRNGYSKKFNMYLCDNIVKTLLYPKWSNDIFCNGKAGSFIYSKRDLWFLTSNLDNFIRYKNIVDYYLDKTDFDRKEKKRNLTPQNSRRYWLE